MKLALRARAKRRGHQRMCLPPVVAPPRGQFTYPPKIGCSREKLTAPTAMAGGSNPEAYVFICTKISFFPLFLKNLITDVIPRNQNILLNNKMPSGGEIGVVRSSWALGSQW